MMRSIKEYAAVWITAFIVGTWKCFFSWPSPGFFHVFSCKGNPTCSEYAGRVIARHGIRKGSLFFFRRFSQCRPGMIPAGDATEAETR